MTRYDDDTERTFAALPPAHGRGFAQTWWGLAWLKALEDAALDASQVKTGRRLARAGAVGAVSVRPGRITAVVQDRDRTAHRADVLLERLSDAQWDRFVDLAIERSGHVAALLDREMPPHLVEDAATAGIDLLPGLGDLEPECDCGAWDHCGHTAALCYQVARLLDQDPFVLLLMRGRAESAVLDALQSHGGAPGEEGTRRPDGVDAAEAYAAGHVLPPLPALPGLPEGPGAPPSLDTETAAPPDVDPAALSFLAARAAAEAHRLLAEALRGGHGRQAVPSDPDAARDAVRLAAGDPDPDVLRRLGVGSGPYRRVLGRRRVRVAARGRGRPVRARGGVDGGGRHARTRACGSRVGLGRGRAAVVAGTGQPLDRRRRTAPAPPGPRGPLVAVPRGARPLGAHGRCGPGSGDGPGIGGTGGRDEP